MTMSTEIKKVATAMGRALRKMEHPVPRGVLLHALAAASGETNWHVLNAKGLNSTNPEDTKEEATDTRLTREDHSYIRGIIRAMQGVDMPSAAMERAIPEGILERLDAAPALDESNLVLAAQNVIDRWEKGDLAEAVRELDAVLTDIKSKEGSENLESSSDVPLLEIGAPCLSASKLREMERNDRIEAVVEVRSSDLIDGNLETLMDLFSERITGSECGLSDISYRSEPVTKFFPGAVGTLAYRVSAAELLWETIPEGVSIPAEIHSDDRVVEVEFDAVDWFEQATNKELQALVNSDFAKSEASDAVGEWMESRSQKVAKVFSYVSIRQEAATNNRDPIGYEVTVDIEAAKDWLRANRPSIELDE